MPENRLEPLNNTVETSVPTSPTLQELEGIFSDRDLFSSLDRHFALFMGGIAKDHSLAAALGAALVSRTTGAGNICLDLAAYAGKPLSRAPVKPGMAGIVCPPLADWVDQLMQTGIAGPGEGNTPLVLDSGHRLYLRRYWEYENSIIRFIRQRSNAVYENLDYSRLCRDLDTLFQPRSAVIDWQQIAAVAAVTRSFCVISGGPGTGKTSTVARILALLTGQHEDKGAGPPRIILGAPTGKAASRLQQAIEATGLLQTGTDHPQATTLHRMLGYAPNSPYFRHNAENPLPADIIVVDEASMVDLPLMAKLMQAVPASARLILLGDRHQLASVQPGSVLGDICRTEMMACFSDKLRKLMQELTGYSVAPAPPSGAEDVFPFLQDSFVELQRSYRFAPDSAIARLSRAVREGDGDGALDLLQTGDDSIAWSEIPAPDELWKKLRDSPDVSQFAGLQQTLDPASCFSRLENFRILCALRSGPFGVERVNTILEQHFASQTRSGSKNPLQVRPIMVTRNDYNLQLFNGDVGIIMPDPKDRGMVRAFFLGEHGLLRDIATPLLPGHETVFAMTVHKSQGSEFNRALLILPDRDSPLLTRELLYTAITRARERLEIWGRKELFAAAVKRRISRTSGLADAL